MDFSQWLHNNTKLADSSIYKYSRAAQTISNEMLNLGVINKPLNEMEIGELQLAVDLISFNTYFIEKDKRGNKMYSNALKQFKYYYVSTYETSNDVEQKIIDTINN